MSGHLREDRVTSMNEIVNWHAAGNVLCRDIVPTGGTSGHLGRNRDCPAEIGTLDMSECTILNPPALLTG